MCFKRVDQLLGTGFQKLQRPGASKNQKMASYTKKIAILAQYLKKSYFRIVSYYDAVSVGGGQTLFAEYKSQYMLGSTVLNLFSFKWSSRDSSVASVSQKGVVKAKKAGSVKITAKLKTETKIKFSTTLNVVS